MYELIKPRLPTQNFNNLGYKCEDNVESWVSRKGILIPSVNANEEIFNSVMLIGAGIKTTIHSDYLFFEEKSKNIHRTRAIMTYVKELQCYTSTGACYVGRLETIDSDECLDEKGLPLSPRTSIRKLWSEDSERWLQGLDRLRQELNNLMEN